MSFLKIGVMGCGRITRHVHLNVLSRLPGSRLVALAEPDKERRTEAVRLFPEATALADYHELLKLRDVEAVIICLPNELHAEAAIAAFQNGKHVYLEKPLSTRRDEGKGVIAAWRRSGLVGMIGLNYRFNRLYRAAKQAVQSERLGEWVGARSVFSSAKHVSTAWDSFEQKSNVLFDLATHHVDLLHFFFGQSVKNVSAVALPRGGDGESVMLQIELFNGPLIQSFFSSSAVEEDRFEIYGRAGRLTVDRYHSLDVEIMDPIRHSDRSKEKANAGPFFDGCSISVAHPSSLLSASGEF